MARDFDVNVNVKIDFDRRKDDCERLVIVESFLSCMFLLVVIMTQENNDYDVGVLHDENDVARRS